MGNMTKKVLSVILSLSMIFSVILSSNIVFADKDNNENTTKYELKLNRNKALVGNKINVFFEGEENTPDELSYIKPDGEKINLTPEHDEDAGFYFFTINPDIIGEWKLDSLKVDGVISNINKEKYNITIYNNLKEMTGKTKSYLSTENLKDSYDNISQVISDVVGIDDKGEFIEYNISVDGNNFKAKNYGLVSETNGEVPEINSGNHKITFSLNDDSITKNINIEESVNSDDNISKLSAKLSSYNIERIEGKDRSETAVKISQEQYRNPSSADNVVLVNGNDYPDALATASFAYIKNAPILYVENNYLKSSTINEIKRIKPKHVYIIGGTKGIGLNIESTLDSMGFKSRYRLDGGNRYSTATKIADWASEVRAPKEVILVNGGDYSDALSAGAYSAKNTVPILYTGSKSLDANTKAFLNGKFGKGIGKVTIVGGKTSVSSTVENQVKSLGKKVERIGESNRYDTSLAFAGKKYGNTSSVVMASGIKYPDALSGGPYAASKNAPVLLADNKVSSNSKNYLSGDKKIVLLGGRSTIELDIETNLSSQSGIKILLDAGHGQGSAFNRGFVYVGANSNEGDNNYYLTLELKKELEKYGFKIGLTRNSIAQDPSLAARGLSAAGYDLFISVHSNAAGASVRGTEVFDDVSKPNKTLASKISKNVASAFGHNNRGVKYKTLDNGSNYYGVLRNNKAKHGMLVEHGFHTNKQDATILVHSRQKIAQAEAKAIAEYYGLTK